VSRSGCQSWPHISQRQYAEAGRFRSVVVIFADWQNGQFVGWGVLGSSRIGVPWTRRSGGVFDVIEDLRDRRCRFPAYDQERDDRRCATDEQPADDLFQVQRRMEKHHTGGKRSQDENGPDRDGNGEKSVERHE